MTRKRLPAALVMLIASILAMAAFSPAMAGSDGDDHRGDRRGDDHEDDDADGMWCYTPVFTRVAPIDIDGAEDDYNGPKLFFTTFEQSDWTGVFEGVARDYGYVSFPTPESLEVGPTVFAGTVIFDSVDVRGRTGGLEFDVHGGRLNPTAEWEGTWIISSASGELEGLTGYGTWWGPGYSLDTPDDCGVIYYEVERLRGLRRVHRDR